MTKKNDVADLNKPDQFHSLFTKLMDFYALNKRRVLLVAGALMGVVAVVTCWSAYHYYYEKNAWDQYAKIEESTVKSPSPDQNNDLIKKYRTLSSEYPQSQASLLSQYRLGNLYFNINDLDAAVSSYNKYVDEASDRNEFKVLSYSGLAYCYEAKKDYQKAVQALQQAEKIEGGKSLETFIYRDMGRIYEKMGNAPEALKCYKKALTQSVDPTFTMFIKRKIALLS
jgi:tetratricopeptide (TPR) repeat protein